NRVLDRQALDTRCPHKALCGGSLQNIGYVLGTFHGSTMRQGDHIRIYSAGCIDDVLCCSCGLVQGHDGARANCSTAGEPDMRNDQVYARLSHLGAFLGGADIAGCIQANLSSCSNHFDFAGEAQSNRLKVTANISVEPRYSWIVDDTRKSDLAELLKKAVHISRRI